jgi:hypothetical protein
MTCNGYVPHFQPQNPALSGDRWGWFDCTAFSAGMAGDYHTCGATRLTGGRVRAESNEATPNPASPGLDLAQIDAVLNRHGIDLDVQYAYPWAAFASRINQGQGAILQILYAPLNGTHYDADPQFHGNHAIFVPPGWAAMDPLADGRRSGIYKYGGEAYPQSLLRTAAGRLVTQVKNGVPQHLGDGLVYAAFTRDNTSNTRWYANIRPAPGGRRSFWRYWIDSTGRVTHRTPWATGGFQNPCSAPSYKPWGAGKAHLVQITAPASSYNGWWVDAAFAREVAVP